MSGQLAICGLRLAIFGIAASLAISTLAQEPSSPKGDTSTKPVVDQLTGSVDPFEEGFTRQGFLLAAGTDMELDRNEFTGAKTRLLEGKEQRSWLRPFDAWPGLAKFDKKNEKGEASNTIDWNEFHEYRHMVQQVLFKHHDQNKDRKLTGEERDNANRALAGNKLMGYLDAGCCGGSTEAKKNVDVDALIRQLADRHKVPVQKTELASMRSEYLSRKERVMNEAKVIGGTPESQLLPITQVPTPDELDSMLRSYYESQLSEVMPEKDWRALLEIIRDQLEWNIGGHESGLGTMHRTNARFIGMEVVEDQKVLTDLARIRFLNTETGSPAYRLGFTGKAITVEKGEDIPQIPLLKDGYSVIHLSMVERVASSMVLTGEPRFADEPDKYEYYSYEFWYVPNRDAPLMMKSWNRKKIAESELTSLQTR